MRGELETEVRLGLGSIGRLRLRSSKVLKFVMGTAKHSIEGQLNTLPFAIIRPTWGVDVGN